MDKAQQEACQLELSNISTVKKVLNTHSSVSVALVQYAIELQPDFVCVGSRGLGAIQRSSADCLRGGVPRQVTLGRLGGGPDPPRRQSGG
eukprot:1185244-Prorocentrum_minimum.AAC.1